MTEEEYHRRLSGSQLLKRYTRTIKAGERTWQDWVDIGEEVALRRIEARLAANNTTRGKTYSARLKDGLTVFYPIFQKISKNGTLLALDNCLGQRAMVQAYRLSIPEDQRPNHPVSVWRGFQASSFSPFYDTADEDDDDAPPPNREVALSQDREKSSVSRKLARGKPKGAQDRMTNAPDLNASRIMLSLIEQLGRSRGTLEVALDTGHALIKMAEHHLDAYDDD